jgi:hypothetical protein
MVAMVAVICYILAQQPVYMKTIRQASDEDAHGNYRQALVLTQKAIAEANAKGTAAKANDLMLLHQFAATYAAKVNNTQLTASEDMETSRMADLAGNKANAGQFALNGAMYEDRVDRRTAQQYFKQAVKAEAQLFGNDSPQLVPALMDAAGSAGRCNTDDDMKVSLSYLEQAAKIAKDTDRNQELSPDTKFLLYRELGEAYAYFKRFADAEEPFALAETAAKEAKVDPSELEHIKKWRDFLRRKLQGRRAAGPTGR